MGHGSAEEFVAFKDRLRPCSRLYCCELQLARGICSCGYRGTREKGRSQELVTPVGLEPFLHAKLPLSTNSRGNSAWLMQVITPAGRIRGTIADVHRAYACRASFVG